ASWFPDPFNADTWNLGAISPWVSTYTIGIGTFPLTYNQPKGAFWLQDDWRTSDRLTLNLGLRYDLFINQWANKTGFGPSNDPERYIKKGRPNDFNTLQPRLGFAYKVNEQTGIRG